MAAAVMPVGALLSSLASGDVPPANLTNPYLVPPLGQGGTQFLVFHGEFQANYAVARTRCVSLGGELADVDSLELLHHLASHLHGPAFVLGFLGDSLGDDCAAIYPGAAVAVPEASCREVLDSVCEVAVMGTASIDVNAQHVAAIAKSPLPNTNKDIHVVPHGFFRQAKDARQAGVTATVNIMGSIATNPVLPCCRCCG